MIASCEQGIYVNRVANIEVIDTLTGLMLGVTHGGCYLVEHGKITTPVKIFAFSTRPSYSSITSSRSVRRIGQR